MRHFVAFVLWRLGVLAYWRLIFLSSYRHHDRRDNRRPAAKTMPGRLNLTAPTHHPRPSSRLAAFRVVAPNCNSSACDQGQITFTTTSLAITTSQIPFVFTPQHHSSIQ